MSFPVGRTQVRVRISSVLFFAFCIVAGEGTRLALALLSLAIHEAAHIIAARNGKASVDCITVYPFGAVMDLGGLSNSSGSEAAAAAAGPIGSLAFAGMLQLTVTLLPETEWVRILIRTNLLIALLNLLPAYPLDGGRIFRALLRSVVSDRTAGRLLLGFTITIALCAEIAGILMIVHGYPAWTALLLPPFLVLSAIGEMKRPDTAVPRIFDRKAAIRYGAPQKAQTVVLSECASIRDAFSTLSNRKYTVLRVIGPFGSVEIDEGTLVDAAAKYGYDTPLKTVISRLTERK